MGCGPSQPKAAASGSATNSVVNGGRQPPKRTDSARSNGSTMRRGGQRKTGATTTSPRNGEQVNGDHSVVAPTTNPQWIYLWETHKDLLQDPADMHAAIEACMARITNKLSVTEITFLQRKVRSIVRASTNTQEKGARMTSILRSNPNLSQEQETKTIAEKYHLLSNHVVKKVLPKLPVSAARALQEPIESTNGGHSTIADNVFLLGLFMHESLWDRVADIATSSAQATGAQMDANHYKLPDEIPQPVPAVATEFPEVPPGISLHALSFIIGLALSKYLKTTSGRLLIQLVLPWRLFDRRHAYAKASTSILSPFTNCVVT